MNKDFKPGDKVSVVFLEKVMRGVVRDSLDFGEKPKGDFVFIQDTETGGMSWFLLSSVFHGHNVTVKIEGEELPERLKTEEVWVGCVPFVEMPVHIAKQYREWRDGKDG